MNERVKELARMSGFTVDETGTFPEFAEKTRLDCFAELIVEAICYDIMNLHGCDPERVQMAARKFGVDV